MGRPIRVIASAAIFSCLVAASAVCTAQQSEPLGPGPAWSGPVRPTAHNAVFATGDGCAMCHSLSDKASAMRSRTGDDISPHGLWQASMMANSFRDPYWRAQVAKESAANPGRAGEVQALCLRCHAPMAHHTAKLGGQPALTMAQAAVDPLAHDGVSCTVCHQVQPDGLGEAKSFSGQITIGSERVIFGPYPDPAGDPMRMHARYSPTFGAHVKSSALCGACHTLETGHTGAAFAEQTPYLEWRNSDFRSEGVGCQQCHMPRMGSTRIARNPMGVDFVIQARDDYAAHTFLGGNAFMLELMRQNRQELSVTASDASLQRAVAATRRQLREDTIRVRIGDLVRKDGALEFAVQVENLTGHKFPTGYPARRAWLHVEVRGNRKVLWRTGACDQDGRIEGLADELDVPHVSVVERPEQVVIYEMVAEDSDGKPTTFLSKMHSKRKDTRLLPRGWSRGGPDAAATAPVGTGSDIDFTAGGDQVAFRVPLPADAPAKGLQVVVWVNYQTVPPAWVDALRPVDADEARAFVRMYDAADREPETVGVALKFEDR
jgi:hypothetical protein